MDSRSAAIAPLSRLGRTACWTTQRRCLSSAHPPWGRVACSRSPIYLFTMPIWLFTMTDPGVHLAPIRAFTLDRSECSPWTETRRHFGLPGHTGPGYGSLSQDLDLMAGHGSNHSFPFPTASRLASEMDLPRSLPHLLEFPAIPLNFRNPQPARRGRRGQRRSRAWGDAADWLSRPRHEPGSWQNRRRQAGGRLGGLWLYVFLSATRQRAARKAHGSADQLPAAREAP